MEGSVWGVPVRWILIWRGEGPRPKNDMVMMFVLLFVGSVWLSSFALCLRWIDRIYYRMPMLGVRCKLRYKIRRFGQNYLWL